MFVTWGREVLKIELVTCQSCPFKVSKREIGRQNRCKLTSKTEQKGGKETKNFFGAKGQKRGKHSSIFRGDRGVKQRKTWVNLKFLYSIPA